jgi:hypothetical protein
MFKGGWGPETDGKYVVRQFAIVRARGGRGVAIGVIARPADGSFETGAAMLTDLARAVAKRVRLARTPVAAPCGS